MNRDTPTFLPYGRHIIEDDDIAAVVEALRSDFLTCGPFVERFEQALGERVGAQYVVACATGTAALHLASLGLRLGSRDCVIVPTVTFLATANGPHYTGAEIVFADVDSDTGLLTPETLLDAIKRAPTRPAAVFPVHLAGQSCDMAEITRIATHEGMAVVEDAAHAIGAKTHGLGTVGNCSASAMTCFSFHPVKTIAMGEGGAVTTNNRAIADRLRHIRSHNMVRSPEKFEFKDLAFDADEQLKPWYYEMPEPGFNYRVSDIHCALGLSQLRKLDKFLDRRRALADRYDKALEQLMPIVKPVPRRNREADGWHLYPVLIDYAAAGTNRGSLMRTLTQAGIGTQVHYIPVHMQPYYRRRYGDIRLEGAMRYYDRALSLPLYPGMADEDVDRVVYALTRALAGES